MAGQGDSSVELQDRGPLAAEDVRFLMAAIAPVIDARVDAGAPHGRISPAALQVQADDARLTDASDDEDAQTYAAPEVRAGAAPTARSEVFSLASTTYTLLTGHPPNPYGFATVRRDRPDLGPAVDGVLLQATARTPELRYPTAADFAAALTEALDRPVQPASTPVRAPAPDAAMQLATPPTPSPATTPKPTRNRFEIPEAALPIVFLLLVVFAAAGFMALFLSGS
ncbi:hypothetical protein [Tsukamurella ocularis]|uniref:hypothetical protein n=1 Tax=Tsukamurella ocularis TaxID=1970234 RepID=UPI002169D898|nr:hypothetical protein [Tsukamurella ocularis]MCS3780485.1 cell division septation protein DedD [Tsukamurella ocularis]MCS3785960.1 cell division septation protein DedD [Tsukamurella ocularis]MCS3849324.1 cell division septation protein DedD [Tsukamurella ocularis]